VTVYKQKIQKNKKKMKNFFFKIEARLEQIDFIPSHQKHRLTYYFLLSTIVHYIKHKTHTIISCNKSNRSSTYIQRTQSS